jgi:hypothetical protein
MARRYLAQEFSPLRIGIEFERLRGGAQRLVATDWARSRIKTIADALLRHGSLTGQQIAALT